MAQWIPKTAWKISNLNKRYGQQYVVQNAIGGERMSDLGSYAVSYATAAMHQEKVREKLLKTLQSSRATTSQNPFPGACIIDVRELNEQWQFPLRLPLKYSSSSSLFSSQSFFHSSSSSSSPWVVSIHPHDILSGGAAPLLPTNKGKAELFIVASSTKNYSSRPAQRAVNAVAALRRWGYHNCFVLDYDVAVSLLDAL